MFLDVDSVKEIIEVYQKLYSSQKVLYDWKFPLNFIVVTIVGGNALSREFSELLKESVIFMILKKNLSNQNIR